MWELLCLHVAEWRLSDKFYFDESGTVYLTSYTLQLTVFLFPLSIGRIYLLWGR